MKLFFVFVLAMLFAPVAFAGQLYILSVQGESTIPGKIFAGDLVTLNFGVKNTSGVGQVANDINVDIELNSNDFEAIKDSEEIGALRARASKTVSMRFRAGDSVLPGNYKIPVFLSYYNGKDLLIQREEISFDVSACDILKVQSINLSSPAPHIGDTLMVSALILNDCSTDSRDVVVELKPKTNSTIDPFIVASGTKKKISLIPPGSTEEVVFSMEISDKVDAKTHVFAIDANCGTCSETFSNSFSFRVLGRPELIFSNIEYSVDDAPGSDKQVFPGNSLVFSVQLDNTGEEKAKNVGVSIDFGEGFAGTKKAFLGNIDPDDSGAAIFNLRADYGAEPGEHEGAITVSYTDELGNVQEFSESYSLFVNREAPVNPVVYVFILAGLAAVLGVLYLIIKFVSRQLALRKSQLK